MIPMISRPVTIFQHSMYVVFFEGLLERILVCRIGTLLSSRACILKTYLRAFVMDFFFSMQL